MKKILVALLLLILVLATILFFSLNFLVTKAVNTLGPKITKVEVHLGSADLSPFSGSGRLSGLLVGNPAGFKTPYAMLLGSIKIKTKTDSVFSNTIVVNEFAIENPEISLEGTPFVNNLGRLLENLKVSSKSASEESANSASTSKRARKFIVSELLITGAKLHVSFNAANKSFDQTLMLPDIHIQDIGTSEGGVSAAELAQRILTPLINSAIRSGTGPLLKEGLKSLNIKGGDQINKALNSLFK